VYVALAGVMLNYGSLVKEWCSQHNRKAAASLKCEAASLADGLFQEMCKSNELGVEGTTSIILTTSVTLILQACTCACYAAVIYGFVYVCVCVSVCVCVGVCL
jgi:chorismate mutase